MGTRILDFKGFLNGGIHKSLLFCIFKLEKSATKGFEI